MLLKYPTDISKEQKMGRTKGMLAIANASAAAFFRGGLRSEFTLRFLRIVQNVITLGENQILAQDREDKRINRNMN